MAAVVRAVHLLETLAESDERDGALLPPAPGLIIQILSPQQAAREHGRRFNYGAAGGMICELAAMSEQAA